MSELAERVIRTLRGRTLSLGVAESLTGGLIGATLTAVPGASAVYVGGVVAYATRTKTDLLGVEREVIERSTVVSEDVAIGMAVGLQRRTNADWVIAVTGVAGPDGQDGHAPGEVWICVTGPRIPHMPASRQVERLDFEGDREAVRAQTVDMAFRMLLRMVSPV